MIEFFKSQMQNQIVGGGLLLLLTGSIIALIRSLPGKCVDWVRRQVMVEVEVLNSDPIFDHLTFWLNSQPYAKRSRRLTATSKLRLAQDDDDVPPCGADRKPPQVILTPAPGIHVFFYRHKVLWLNRNREETSPAGGRGDFASLLKRESYHLKMFGRSQKTLRALITEIVAFSANREDGIRVFQSGFGYWKSIGRIKPRKLDSVVLPDGVAEEILEDLRKFLASADWYRSVGIPWHRGYLLHGVPGSGKTSLVCALAGELGMDLYSLSLSGMDDERLHSLISSVRPGTIVLMEDIDCTVPDRESATTAVKRVTLSGLLNCLDGVQSQEGCVIFMTTNAIKKLDAALIRPGRIDVPVEFGYATESQVLRLCERLGSDISTRDALAMVNIKSMAEVQQSLLSEHPVACASIQREHVA